MRTSYIGRTEIIPSEQAISVMESVLGFGHEKLLLMARSGSHNLNPYHNTLHELQNVYYSWSCYVNESAGDRSGPGIAELLRASMFHDHNHSGGLLRDDRNVERAVEFAQREVGLGTPALRIIKVTQFVDGKFPIEPTNLAEKCIRDADLMTIYSKEGFRLMLGLFEEFHSKPFARFTDKEIEDTISLNDRFLRTQTMYTDHGNRMREEHLHAQLRKFEEYVWHTFSCETAGRPTPATSQGVGDTVSR